MSLIQSSILSVTMKDGSHLYYSDGKWYSDYKCTVFAELTEELICKIEELFPPKVGDEVLCWDHEFSDIAISQFLKYIGPLAELEEIRSKSKLQYCNNLRKYETTTTQWDHAVSLQSVQQWRPKK